MFDHCVCDHARARARDTQYTSARHPARARPHFGLDFAPSTSCARACVCCICSARPRPVPVRRVRCLPLSSARTHVRRARSLPTLYRGGTGTESTSILYSLLYRSVCLSRDSIHSHTTSRPPYHAPYGTHNSWLQRWPLRVITPSSGRCRSARRTRAAAAAARPPRPPVGRGASLRGPGPLAAPPPAPARSPRSR